MSPRAPSRAAIFPPAPSRAATVSRSLLRAAIRGYQLFLSPIAGGSCRFHPSCSQYAIEAIERHGSLRGTGLALRRILRCNPWHEGGHDPVPPAAHASRRERSARRWT